MIKQHRRTPNEIAYRKLKPKIDKAYTKGRFIAIHNQMIVEDAATLPKLLDKLADRSSNSKECLVVQSGFDYPEFAYIF